ncbi:AAA family ATPase [Mariniblastus fucicola]|uniref:AAA family ATPase n=1 Tax=Mariniblastus fucicola TaxID=980251 RepID=UPI0012FA9DD0|nr:AAA family ATPase [Mariniblastus fucicola]
MKITDLQVDGFGVWKGLDVDSLSGDMTIFHGYNEAGKTTLMQFVRSMMFGFSPGRLDKYTPPVYGGLAGGGMNISTPNGSWDIARHVDPNRHSDPIGDLTVTDEHDGSVHGSAQLASLMADVDESIFNNVFAIGLREIQELGALNSTAASEYLYRLTSGVDRVSLIDVMRDLKNRREKIWSANPKAESRLQVLSDRRQKLLREIDELKQNAKRWSRIASETTDVNHQLDDLKLKLKKTERESRLIEIAIQIAERWQSRTVVRDQIAAYSNLPDERDVSIKKLDEINEKVATQKERIEQVRTQRRTIKAEAMSLPINRHLWSQKARVEAISEHAPWVQSLERQTESLRDEIDGIEKTLVAEVNSLGPQMKLRAKDVRDIGGAGFRQLESVGDRLVDGREALEVAKQDVEKRQFDLGQHNQRLTKSRSELGVSESLEETSAYVNRLKRRVELGEKIDKLNRSRSLLEREIDSVVAEQVLPVEKLAVIGGVFILGFILIGLGIFSNNFGFGGVGASGTSSGLLLLFLGTAALAISLGTKYHWEKMAKEQLDDFRHQMDIVRQQLKRAKHERDEIEKQLPPESIAQFELELDNATNRLNRLTDLVPLEHRVENTKMSMEDARRNLSVKQRELETLEKNWRTALRTAGLPEALEPEQLKEIISRSDRISAHNSRLEQLRTELDSKQKEISTIQQRIETTLHETGLPFEEAGLSDRLGLISRAINEQRIHVSARKELASKYKSLRSRLNKTKRELDRQLGIKQRLLAAVGAESEEAYRQIASRHAQRRKLEKKRAELDDQIRMSIGKQFEHKEMQEIFATYGSSGLEKRWESIQQELELDREEQNRLMQHRGELMQEVKALGDDSRLDEVRLELNSIETEIGKLKLKWQELGASSQMLEMIRESYETKRQPETLREASQYLEKLSDGKYTRIWTRMTGEELLVDNANDESIAVDKLSRGTREAVFLSLRLALVGAYARRGALIPMVLDDVLVNFDGQRARNAAEVLYDFSRNGYQILMFTCHDHIRDIFHSLGADVRVLPAHKDVFESQVKPAKYEGEGQRIEFQVSQRETPVEPRPQPIPMQTPEPVLEPASSIDPYSIPVEYVAPASRLNLQAESFDEALAFELSAIELDQREEHRLRHELVYISPSNHEREILLGGNDPIWWQSNAVMR